MGQKRSYIGLGIALGVALGAAFGKIGVGIALGVAIGAALEWRRTPKDPGDSTPSDPEG